MGKYIRVCVVIIILLGLFMVLKDQPASAANPVDQTHQVSAAQAQSSPALGKDYHCDDDEDEDKEKGKDKYQDKDNWTGKDKDKDKCKDKDDEGGTVVPPDDDIEVCKRGDYSVGGVATLDVRNLRGHYCLTARARDVDPVLDQLPEGAGTILTDVIVLKLPAKGSNVRICFAVPPGEQVTIYSFTQGVWTALRTTVKNGIACAVAGRSGNYTLVGQ